MADIKYNIIKDPENENQEKTRPNYGELVHEWSYKEFEEVQRGKLWYIIAGIVILLLCFYCIKTDNFLFMMIIIMSFLFIVMFKTKKPGYIYFSIFETGIEIDRMVFYSWDMIDDFYIIYDNERLVKKLYFTLGKTFKKTVCIDLEKEDPMEIRDILRRYLPENTTRKYEHLSDRIEKKFKL